MSKIVGTIETKSGVQKCTDGLELGHNSLVMFSSTLLYTTNGTTDNESAFGTRIGYQKKLTLRNLVVKGMVELNERYSDVTVKVIVIKSAKGDEPTNDTLWQGSSGNKLLDNFNTERFTILKSKILKLRAPNMAIVSAAADQQATGSGFTIGTTATITEKDKDEEEENLFLERERERERDGVWSAISPFLGGLLESWHYYPSHGTHIDVSFESLSLHTYRCICQDPEKVLDRVTMVACA